MILPFVRDVFADVEKSPALQRAIARLKGGAGGMRVSGLTPTGKALFYPLLQRATSRPLLVIVSDNRAVDELLPVVRSLAELTGAVPPESILGLPAYDVLPFENLSPHPEIQEERATALWKIATGAAHIVITPFVAASMRLRDAAFYAALARVVRRGEMLDPEKLVDHLRLAGYAQVDVVEMPGEFAHRGGLIDVYPPESDRPVRIEMFGDEVESLRKFDPTTQRSAAAAEEIALLPLTETPVDEDTLAAINARLSGNRLAGADGAVEEAVRYSGVSVFPGWELYAPVAAPKHTLFELLPAATVVLDEPDMLGGAHDAWWTKLTDVHERSLIGNLVRPEDLYLSPTQWDNELRRCPLLAIEQLGIEDSADGEHIILQTQPTMRFHGSVAVMTEEVGKLTSEGKRVMFAVSSTGEVERLADVFNEYNLSFRIGSRTPKPGMEVFVDESTYFADDVAATIIVKAYVPEGVALPEANLILFGSHDLFDEPEVSLGRPQRQKSKVSAFLSDFRDLAVGDYVVHVEHGIGQYQGLKEVPQEDGAPAEFMVLEYAEGAKLYVPLTRLDLVQKYRSSEGAKPVLNRLGTAQWQKTKARVKKAMQDMADELLKLYAARKNAEGHAFAADSEWQHEFEDAFEFSETEDQMNAIVDVKHDMEASTPMDRLLCGDVGYGKTEVAMRAAFKAVQDGRQVAVLAPTTVLTFQHYNTFKQRLAAFPLKIEMLSRFRTPRQLKESLAKLEAGELDIAIGTHRLLSKDVKFHNLGLVVVDEEQRFGVRHKERLKQLRKEVDVLTMSATPIPRTLHMSLLGLRDMSVIETPPKDRMAIQTVVAAWDHKLIRSAIEKELERGGQVYFVHNRVESIYDISEKIREMVPRARILVGHGQMPETELERVMLAFMRHEADILVATTIIENGLDIPLCNTIIINRADRHGLSELYQLRGRVGRSDRRAYAYLMIPPDRDLTDLARRRLAALREFSDLGAGFKIAALDLELRGAGNLLGGEQSGHIEAVGFELYTTMLERTVRELKGELEPETPETQLNLGLNIRIPAEYIAEENQRLRMYKRVAGVETEAQLNDVAAELGDRYGQPPPPVRNLLEYAELKLLAQRVGVAQIERRKDAVSIRFTEKATVDPERLSRFVHAEPGSQFTPAGVLKFTLKEKQPEVILTRLKALLEQLAGEELVVQ
ncbi:MAG TPA: transcription-repair coupling factor [Candidatus Eisenbacteria bacterium]|nr:transcription-repair coupling factor [Candidatus Eisenbacteria bacterium]